MILNMNLHLKFCSITSVKPVKFQKKVNLAFQDYFTAEKTSNDFNKDESKVQLPKIEVKINFS